MKVISTKRTTVMGLLHCNMPIVCFHSWGHELLIDLKTWASEKVPRASKI